MKTERIENMCGGKGHVTIKHLLEEKRAQRQMWTLRGGNH